MRSEVMLYIYCVQRDNDLMPIVGYVKAVDKYVDLLQEPKEKINNLNWELSSIAVYLLILSIREKVLLVMLVNVSRP